MAWPPRIKRSTGSLLNIPLAKHAHSRAVPITLLALPADGSIR